MKNIKNIVIIVLFALMLCGTTILSVFLPDGTVSDSERRPLTQMQSYADYTLQNKKGNLQSYFSHIEDYLLDQFPARDGFRSLKAIFKTKLLFQSDTNGYYLQNGNLFKLDSELSENAVNDAMQRFNGIYASYFENTDAAVYYSIIPDKNYFSTGYPKYDYGKLYETVRQSLGENFTEIDLLPYLSLSDYYHTDPHLSQDKITDAAQALLKAMKTDCGVGNYTETVLSPFKGTYYGQAALPINTDRIVYLTNDIIASATVYNYEKETTEGVYNPDYFTNTDPYDVFLQGAAALLKIENPAQDNGRQLVLFRDSFGSSMAPLLIEGYSEIIVVDIRYISPKALGTFTEFKDDCDVLFLYSTSVLNSLGAFMN